jgi:hypothetical protein
VLKRCILLSRVQMSAVGSRRFEVAGDGNQDKVNASEALSSKRSLSDTESNRSASPKSQAPSLDPTRRQRLRRWVASAISFQYGVGERGRQCKAGGADWRPLASLRLADARLRPKKRMKPQNRRITILAPLGHYADEPVAYPPRRCAVQQQCHGNNMLTLGLCKALSLCRLMAVRRRPRE